MKINMSHGNGGRETSKLINDVFMKYFKNEQGTAEEDSAVLDVTGKIAFTTDSFVVKPLFFNGGDIGRLAVCGTVNDLLTSGAIPLYISAGFIIEEGLDIEELEKIVCSMSKAAKEADVIIVTGDTKVTDGNGGIYISTSGIGKVKKRVSFKDGADGDIIIITGTSGDHQACITSARTGIKNNIKSDNAPLNKIVSSLQSENITLHGIRDVTRGGLATCLNEAADLCRLQAHIYEKLIPLNPEVQGLCDILGLDPLYMANEGKMLITVPENEADSALQIIQSQPYGSEAAVIGEFRKPKNKDGNSLVMTTKIGGERILPPLTGESLPRIC